MSRPWLARPAPTAALEVGRWITQLRRRLGLSQAVLARQAHISRNSLLDYERGKRVPKTAPLARIAGAGGSSVDWLLNGRVPRARPREDPGGRRPCESSAPSGAIRPGAGLRS